MRKINRGMRTIGGWRFWLGVWAGIAYADVTHAWRLQRLERDAQSRWLGRLRTIVNG